MNQMKKIFILLFLLNFSQLSLATSTPYRGGEVAIDIKIICLAFILMTQEKMEYLT